ncbi:MAG: FAD/NAD(P)-binding protein [Thermoanaerobaculia bacterium]|nr:FAD/NAD(P)-binding protein [Thermoanaerobaculia bacterium]
MSTDWLIIGGGIHGVHIAARLIGEADVDPDRIRIVDPERRLLARWRRCTATTGMTHLRSPVVHHLDLDSWSLKRFAGNRKTRRSGLFAPPHDRPALSLFNAHCDKVLATFGLADLHIRSRVVSCSVAGDGVRVELSNGRQHEARQVVLALGASEQPHWPDWAPRGHDRVHHVFESKPGGWPSAPETVAVVGGGISAAQVALRLVREEHEVHLVSRHALREHQFDSDPGWLGPKLMTSFRRVRDVDRRRSMIAEARHRGSVPPDVRRGVRRSIHREILHWHEGEGEGLDAERGALRLRLSGSRTLNVDRVVLATGFTSRRPGGSMVDELIASESLPCAQCGYPVVDSGLRWHPRIHVSGPLAELELGPASRNIAGARRAAERLVGVVRRKV